MNLIVVVMLVQISKMDRFKAQWVESRFPESTMKLTLNGQHLTQKRAKRANYEIVHVFSEKFEKLLNDFGIHYADDLAEL